MLAIRVHSQWMGGQPLGIRATGGASKNPEIRQIMADVLGCPVYHAPVSNSAALGAAIRAAHAVRQADGRAADWAELTTPASDEKALSAILPNSSTRLLYDRMAEEYAVWEREALAEIERSSPLQKT